MSMSSMGGYRQPENPAPASGPGALSQRTDGGATEGMSQPEQSYTGFAYGENKSINDQQGEAPLAGPRIQPPVALDVPTQFPNEPDSYGANWGEGPGVDTSMISMVQPENPINTIYRMMQFDQTGQYQAIYNRMNME
jgi:hypothetical protein